MNILVLLALLLLPLTVEAGEPLTSLTIMRQDGELQYDVNGSLKIDKQSFEALLRDDPEAKLRVTLVPDHCLATMEAAMRAVDWWVKESNRGALPHEKPYIRMLMADEFLQQWENAKRQCWRQP